jgi:hypothetical protein
MKLRGMENLPSALITSLIIHSTFKPLGIRPDAFEKDLGSIVAKNPELSNLDSYTTALADEINVYTYYSKLLDSFTYGGLEFYFVQFIISMTICLFIFKISSLLFGSLIPGFGYVCVMTFMSGRLVFPDFLYSDSGIAPRQFALISFIVSIWFFLKSGISKKVGVCLGLGSLIHPSAGITMYSLYFLSALLMKALQLTQKKELSKSLMSLSASFILSGGWFSILISIESLRLELLASKQDRRFSLWVFTELRHPFYIFDWRHLLMFCISVGITSICFRYLCYRKMIKTLHLKFLVLMTSSLIMYVTFIVGVTIQSPLLVSFFGVRVYNLWVLGSILILTFSLYVKFFNQESRANQKVGLAKSYIDSGKMQISIFILFVLVSISCSIRIMVADRSNYDKVFSLNEEIESLMHFKLRKDEILADPTMQIVGSVANLKTIPRTSGDIIEWTRRLDTVTRGQVSQLYQSNSNPVIFWDSEKSDLRPKLSEAFQALTIEQILSICEAFPLKIIVSKTEYRNNSQLIYVDKIRDYSVYRILCNN